MQSDNGVLTILRGKDHDFRLLYLDLSEVVIYHGSQRDYLAEMQLILGNHNKQRKRELRIFFKRLRAVV